MERCCFRYHKGTDFQANHNKALLLTLLRLVVLDTTKVQIFKQITTSKFITKCIKLLFQIPQRYRFSSKSQLAIKHFLITKCCFRYHKGTDFQANHNSPQRQHLKAQLFQIPQRYRFSSKSQQKMLLLFFGKGCFRYHKGTDFQANHNKLCLFVLLISLFQIPQRYRFSSKSQRHDVDSWFFNSCFRYHKGTDFQANHNLHPQHYYL